MTEQPNPLSDSEMEPGGLPAPIAADGALESGADPDSGPPDSGLGDSGPGDSGLPGGGTARSAPAAGPADNETGGPPAG